MKIGDIIAAISDRYFLPEFGGQKFVTKGAKYRIIGVNQYEFQIIDDEGHEHFFPFDWMEHKHNNYLFNLVTRKEKLNRILNG